MPELEVTIVARNVCQFLVLVHLCMCSLVLLLYGFHSGSRTVTERQWLLANYRKMPKLSSRVYCRYSHYLRCWVSWSNIMVTGLYATSRWHYTCITCAILCTGELRTTCYNLHILYIVQQQILRLNMLLAKILFTLCYILCALLFCQY